MSRKVMDCCNRWRSKTVSFRMSPEEDALLDSMARLSGMTKQDYIIARLLKFEITVQGNPKVYKAVKQELATAFRSRRSKRSSAAACPNPVPCRIRIGRRGWIICFCSLTV